MEETSLAPTAVQRDHTIKTNEVSVLDVQLCISSEFECHRELARGVLFYHITW